MEKKSSMRSFLLFAFCLFIQSVQSQVLSVTSGNQPPYDATSFINNFFTGAGIQVLDVEFGGTPGAVGFFSDGINAIGLERGILLTTGSAATTLQNEGADGIGSEFASTNNPGNVVSIPLMNIATAALHDVVYYKITFQPTSDSIRFRYVFASEEYLEYVCSNFNDIFGFFLTGPRPGNPQPYSDFNIALVPGTNLPVAINNVHPGNIDNNCGPLNEVFFNDNNSSLVQPVYDGFTVPFTAEASVVPCETYEMVLAVGDVADGVFDTGVFLEGNSFGGAIEVTASFGPSDNVIPENATGDTVSITFSNLPPALLPLTVTIGGDAENGVDYETIETAYTISTSDSTLNLLFQPIADTLTEGLETLLIEVTGPGCTAYQFTLFLSDPDSSMLQGNDPIVSALVNGTAHLEVMPTAFSGMDFTFSNETDYTIQPANTLISSEIDITMPFASIGDLGTIESVCFDIEHGWADDVDVFLIAPDGRFVELTTDNGGNGDNYTGTCFSPDATDPINFPGPFAPASAAPFTGLFKAEGQWSDLTNAPITGTWALGVTDDNVGVTGALLGWRIVFSGARVGSFHYLWNTGDTTASIDVTEPGIYLVKVSNAVSHFEQKFVVTEECPHSQLVPQVCADGQFELNGVTFDAEHPTGTVTFDLPGAECDSTVFVQLAFLPVSSDTVFAQIQSGDMLSMGGQTFAIAGDYVLNLTNTNGCDSLVYLHLDVTTGTYLPGEESLNIRPNPAKELVSISWGKELQVNTIRLYDRFGKLVLEQNVAAYSQLERLEIGHFPADTYMMVLQTADGVVVRKLVKG